MTVKKDLMWMTGVIGGWRNRRSCQEVEEAEEERSGGEKKEHRGQKDDRSSVAVRKTVGRGHS